MLRVTRLQILSYLSNWWQSFHFITSIQNALQATLVITYEPNFPLIPFSTIFVTDITVHGSHGGVSFHQPGLSGKALTVLPPAVCV